MIGQLPSAPASSIFDHPIVGFDNSKIQGGTDESAAKEDNNSAMVPTTLTDDKITTSSTSNHQESSIIDITKDVEKKSSKKANQKAPHAQQQHKKSSSKTYTSYTLNATWNIRIWSISTYLLGLYVYTYLYMMGYGTRKHILKLPAFWILKKGTSRAGKFNWK